MGFISLVYHEVRPNKQLETKPKGIEVADGYEDELPSALYVSVDQFENQMQYLASAGYNFITLDDVFMYCWNDFDMPGKNVLITFDDAYQSMLHYAYPVLKKYDIPATLFVVRDWLFDKPSPFKEETSRVLSLDEILSVKDVFIFANHTASFHRKKELIRVGTSALYEDLDACAWITDYPNVFAYPFGDYDDALIEKLEAWGMKLAFTTETGVNTRDTHPLKMHRTIVPNGMEIDAFKVMINTLSSNE